MSEMRAARYDRYGPPEVLYEGTRPKPVAGPREVLVRVHATSVNGGELLGRAGKLKLVTGRKFPQGTGIDITGEIAEVGSSVSHLAVGDRVWGATPRGTFGAAAEYVAVRPRQLSLAPEGVDLIRAAALPGVGTTAITALRDKIGLRSGERLLVRGAAGGVGSVAVQLGHAFGAHVTGLAGAKALDLVRELGADEAHDYRTTGPTALGPFDAVLDTVGTGLGAYRELLSPGGRMVSIAFDADRPLSWLGFILLSTVHGSRRVRAFSGNPMHELTRTLPRMWRRGPSGRSSTPSIRSPAWQRPTARWKPAVCAANTSSRWCEAIKQRNAPAALTAGAFLSVYWGFPCAHEFMAYGNLMKSSYPGGSRIVKRGMGP